MHDDGRAGRLPHDPAGGGRVIEMDVREQDRANIFQRAPDCDQAGAQGRHAGLGSGIDERDTVVEVQHVHADDPRATQVVQIHDADTPADRGDRSVHARVPEDYRPSITRAHSSGMDSHFAAHSALTLGEGW